MSAVKKSNVIEGLFDVYKGSAPELMPRHALLFYTSHMPNAYSSSGTLVATSHPLTQSNHAPAPIIGAGHLLTESDTREVLQSMLDIVPAFTGFIPHDVLSQSSQHLAWTVKGSVRPMYFKLRGSTKTVTLNVPMPTLLFVAHAKGLSIAALSSTRRPSETTRLFHAPLMNIYSDGRVCLGSAKMPDNISIESRPAIENTIFKTNYAHTNHHNTLNLSKKTSGKQHMAFWRKLHKSKATVFPKAALKPLGVSVASFIEGSIRA